MERVSLRSGFSIWPTRPPLQQASAPPVPIPGRHELLPATMIAGVHGPPPHLPSGPDCPTLAKLLHKLPRPVPPAPRRSKVPALLLSPRILHLLPRSQLLPPSHPPSHHPAPPPFPIPLLLLLLLHPPSSPPTPLP